MDILSSEICRCFLLLVLKAILEKIWGHINSFLNIWIPYNLSSTWLFVGRSVSEFSIFFSLTHPPAPRDVTFQLQIPVCLYFRKVSVHNRFEYLLDGIFFNALEFNITIGLCMMLSTIVSQPCSSSVSGIWSPLLSYLWVSHLSWWCYYVVSKVLLFCEGFTTPFPFKLVPNFYLPISISYNNICKTLHLNQISCLF